MVSSYFLLAVCICLPMASQKSEATPVEMVVCVSCLLAYTSLTLIQS